MYQDTKVGLKKQTSSMSEFKNMVLHFGKELLWFYRFARVKHDQHFKVKPKDS